MFNTQARLWQLSICRASPAKQTYEFQTARSHAPYFIEVEYLKRSTHSKPYKTYRSGALCPKNKIASAISHYRQPHQPPSLNHFPLSVPHSLWQNPSGNQPVSINTGFALSLSNNCTLLLASFISFAPSLSGTHNFFLLYWCCNSHPSAVLQPHLFLGNHTDHQVEEMVLHFLPTEKWTWFLISKSEQKAWDLTRCSKISVDRLECSLLLATQSQSDQSDD